MKVKFKKFCFSNKEGGTVMAGPNEKSEFGLHNNLVLEGFVIKILDDYEIGRTFHVRLDEEFKKIIKHKSKKDVVYVSEFDVIK